jgi:hypothetical protein
MPLERYKGYNVFLWGRCHKGRRSSRVVRTWLHASGRVPQSLGSVQRLPNIPDSLVGPVNEGEVGGHKLPPFSCLRRRAAFYHRYDAIQRTPAHMLGYSDVSRPRRVLFPRRARTINSAGLSCNGRRGESSDHRQFLFASPPSSRTDRGILTQ